MNLIPSLTAENLLNKYCKTLKKLANVHIYVKTSGYVGCVHVFMIKIDHNNLILSAIFFFLSYLKTLMSSTLKSDSEAFIFIFLLQLFSFIFNMQRKMLSLRSHPGLGAR